MNQYLWTSSVNIQVMTLPSWIQKLIHLKLMKTMLLFHPQMCKWTFEKTRPHPTRQRLRERLLYLSPCDPDCLWTTCSWHTHYICICSFAPSPRWIGRIDSNTFVVNDGLWQRDYWWNWAAKKSSHACDWKIVLSLYMGKFLGYFRARVLLGNMLEKGERLYGKSLNSETAKYV